LLTNVLSLNLKISLYEAIITDELTVCLL
jgi:hypothetical protein